MISCNFSVQNGRLRVSSDVFSVPCFGCRPLQWRHSDHDCVSNHQPRGCLLNSLFRRRSKKTSKLRVTGLCVGRTGEFPAQRASYAENLSIWWRHHGTCMSTVGMYACLTLCLFPVSQCGLWFLYISSPVHSQEIYKFNNATLLPSCNSLIAHWLSWQRDVPHNLHRAR